MAIYDGNQLPESPTSQFQLGVSILYTVQVLLFMSYGAVAVLAATEQISTELQATQYMRRLVRKHNAIVRGMIAFIPATFSLGHLYTSSLHNGSLYSASNAIYVILFAFATSYLGGAMQELVHNSTHMDTTKAVYEVLYLFTRGAAKLSDGPCHVLPCLSPDLRNEWGETFVGRAWKSPWVLFNCFLSIATLDDARLWGQFLAWLRRRRRPSAHDVVPLQTGSGFTNLLCRLSTSLGWYPQGSKGYAYWLFSQDGNVYNYTGSVICEQAIPEKLSIASYSTGEMYPAAHCFLMEFSQHFQEQASDKAAAARRKFQIICSAGGSVIEASELLECLSRVGFNNQGMNMAVERYICRVTPDYAALYLPSDYVVRDILKWAGKLYDSADGKIAGNANAVAQALQGRYGSFYCTLWLAYMHMALLGLDLLRMHNNKAVFAQCKQHQAGFFEILKTEKEAADGAAAPGGTLAAAVGAGNSSAAGGGAPVAAAGGVPAAAPVAAAGGAHAAACSTAASALAAALIKAADDAERNPPKQLDYPELYNLSVEDQHGSAAIIATLLLVQWIHTHWEQDLPLTACAAVQSPVVIDWAPKTSSVKLPQHTGSSCYSRVSSCCTSNCCDNWEVNNSYLRSRSQLVKQHSSLPAIVQPLQCPPPSHWVRSLLAPVGFFISCVVIVAVTLATISCSNGVFLAAISGLVQAYAAWALLLHMGQAPRVSQVHAFEGWISATGVWPVLELFGYAWQLFQAALYPAIGIVELGWELLLLHCCFPVMLLGRISVWLQTRSLSACAGWLAPHGMFRVTAPSAAASGQASNNAEQQAAALGSGRHCTVQPPAAPAGAKMTGSADAAEKSADDTTTVDQGPGAYSQLSQLRQTQQQQQQQQQQEGQPQEVQQQQQQQQGGQTAAETIINVELEPSAASLGPCPSPLKPSQLLGSAHGLLQLVALSSYMAEAHVLARALVPSELHASQRTGGLAVATAALAAAEAVATEASCVAVLRSGHGKASDKLDDTLDRQLGFLQSEVVHACKEAWTAEAAGIAHRANQSIKSGTAAAAAAQPEAPPKTCAAVAAAVKAKAAAVKAKAAAAAAAAALNPASVASSAHASAPKGGIQKALQCIRVSTEKALLFICLLQALGISLGSCFDDTCKRLYRHRIRLADVLVHSLTAATVVMFAVCVVLAVTREKFYATGQGMCLGRCHDQPDCWSNITVGLPPYDSHPSCPGEGVVNVNESSYLNYNQCPAVLMVLIVSHVDLTAGAVTPQATAAVATSTATSAAAASRPDQPAAGVAGRRLQGQQGAAPAGDPCDHDNSTSPSPSPSSSPSPAPSLSSSPSPSPSPIPSPRAGASPSPITTEVLLSTRGTSQELTPPSPCPCSCPSPSPSPSPSASPNPASMSSCIANITLIDLHSGQPAKEGLDVSAIWYTMVDEHNELNGQGAALLNITAKTTAEGKVTFTSPPLNGSRRHGCNITLVQPPDGAYFLDLPHSNLSGAQLDF